MDKICDSCKQSKPIALYNKSHTSKDGHRHTCMDCYAIKKQTKHKIADLVILLADAQQTIAEDVYRKKYYEMQMKYDLLIQELTDGATVSEILGKV